MAMGGGGTGGAVSEINVTPLIDVLLVLLIIFMVIVPVTPHGLDALVPQPPKDKTNSEPDTRTIVVSILDTKGGPPAYKINEDSFNKSELEPKLQSIFSTRQEKVMFVKGDPNVFYGDVAAVIDYGHQAGVDNIGIITPKVESGQ
jgi:biopolymer transport protein ExbD/biopolymer transport protein TolR